jgi:hypothetical protein
MKREYGGKETTDPLSLFPCSNLKIDEAATVNCCPYSRGMNGRLLEIA